MRTSRQRIGVPKPIVRKLAREVVRKAGRGAAVECVYPLVRNLWKSQSLEIRHLAICILEGFADRSDASTWELADRWVDGLTEPSLTDALASKVLAPVLVRERSFFASLMDWACSPHRWRRRVVLETVRNLARIRRAYIPETIVLARILAADSDNRVQKPLGRALSECGRMAPTPVRQFLRMHRNVLSQVAWRQATRGLPPSAL